MTRIRLLSVIAVVGLVVGIAGGVVGQLFGLDRAEIVLALLAGGLLALVVHRPGRRRTR
jgi:hypothetical protein